MGKYPNSIVKSASSGVFRKHYETYASWIDWRRFDELQGEFWNNFIVPMIIRIYFPSTSLVSIHQDIKKFNFIRMTKFCLKSHGDYQVFLLCIKPVFLVKRL